MMAGLHHLGATTTTTTNITTTERASTTLTTTETRQLTIGNIREISETTPPVIIAENILRISRTTLVIIENITKNIQSAPQQTINGSTRRIMRGTILA